SSGRNRRMTMCSPPRVAWCRSPEPISLSGMHAVRIRKSILSEYHGHAPAELSARPSLRTRMHGRLHSGQISVAVVDGSAARRIDKMDAASRNARHGLIALLFGMVRIVGDPALYTQAGLGAAVKKCSHRLIVESDRDRKPRRCLGAATVRSRPLARW